MCGVYIYKLQSISPNETQVVTRSNDNPTAIIMLLTAAKHKPMHSDIYSRHTMCAEDGCLFTSFCLPCQEPIPVCSCLVEQRKPWKNQHSARIKPSILLLMNCQLPIFLYFHLIPSTFASQLAEEAPEIVGKLTQYFQLVNITSRSGTSQHPRRCMVEQPLWR